MKGWNREAGARARCGRSTRRSRRPNHQPARESPNEARVGLAAILTLSGDRASARARGCVRSSELSGGGLSSQLLLPILCQHQLIYPVGVKHLMQQQVPEHYIHRVVAERLMLGRPLPIV
jgi:hypothetical protein